MAGRLDPKDLGLGFATIGAVLAAQQARDPVLRATRKVLIGVRSGKALTQTMGEEVLRRGAGGSAPWVAAAALVWGGRAVRRARSRSERILLHEVLQEGERIVITQVPRKAPKGRRAGAGVAAAGR